MWSNGRECLTRRNVGFMSNRNLIAGIGRVRTALGELDDVIDENRADVAKLEEAYASLTQERATGLNQLQQDLARLLASGPWLHDVVEAAGIAEDVTVYNICRFEDAPGTYEDVALIHVRGLKLGLLVEPTAGESHGVEIRLHDRLMSHNYPFVRPRKDLDEDFGEALQRLCTDECIGTVLMANPQTWKLKLGEINGFTIKGDDPDTMCEVLTMHCQKWPAWLAFSL
jgi:hypothetical protein